MIHRGVLKFGHYRYLWLALALLLASVVVFVSQGGMPFSRGDTWQGYTLGTVAAVLIVWLTFLGIRKRRYRSSLGSVQGWTSAHIYLGIVVLAIATLHCAGQFHANIHTYAYLLMSAVIASGLVGLAFYSNLPRQQSANRGGVSRSKLFAELFELDRRARELSTTCDAEIAAVVRSSIERTVIGGGVVQQLSGGDRSLFENPAETAKSRTSRLSRNTDQRAVIAYVSNRVPRAFKESDASGLQQLVVVLSRRQAILRQIRRDISLQGWMRFWLYVHIPLTLATIAALVVHILSTFLYF